MAYLEVDLVATDRKLWSGRATAVTAPAADGAIGILVGHSPVLSVLLPGRVKVTAVDGSVTAADITGGFLSVDADTVTIIVDSAVLDGVESH